MFSVAVKDHIMIAQSYGLKTMSAVDWILAIWAVLACLAWCLTYFRALYHFLSIPLLKQFTPQEPQYWPKLSVVIPARNEADMLEQAVTTLLTQDYPNLELLLINDRSTDDTGSIIDRMVALDSRILPIHINSLPAGWLGQVHAMHIATQKVSGEWMLLTDAVIDFQPGSLRKVVALCLEQQIDHLAILHKNYQQSFWQQVLSAALEMVSLLQIKAADIGKPGSDRYIGTGAFALVRKSVFDRTEGFNWLRMELCNDLGLGLMMNRAGAKGKLMFGMDEIGLTWYKSLPAMVRGLEKHLFGLIAQFRYSKMIFSALSIWLLIIGWGVAFLRHEIPYLWTLGVVAYLSLVLYALITSVKLKLELLPILLMPIGQFMLSIISLRSAILCWQRQGIVWADTIYPLEPLRAGQHVKL
ncbi:glycosyltransferase [Nostoc sp.]|uniref:glycosyltransferase n=1 Tax=Nostoc sp. TaxID=1180 RepID=UPI002FF61530